MSPAGSRGKKVSRTSSERLLAGPPFDNGTRVMPLARLEFSHARCVSRVTLGDSTAPRRPTTHPTRTCICTAATSRCSRRPRFTPPAARSRASSLRRWPAIPFPDATPQFFAALNAALSLGLAAPIEISAPFAHLHKEDVVKIGAALGVPFELTLSCMNPSGTTHCGLCSKCRERRTPFTRRGSRIRRPTPTSALGSACQNSPQSTQSAQTNPVLKKRSAFS